MDTRPSLPEWHQAPADAFSPDRAMVQRWLDAYVAAWQSYEESEIADLWTDDAVWFRPFGVRATGRAGITAEWMAERHIFEGGGCDAAYLRIRVVPGRVMSPVRDQPVRGPRRRRAPRLPRISAGSS